MTVRTRRIAACACSIALAIVARGTATTARAQGAPPPPPPPPVVSPTPTSTPTTTPSSGASESPSPNASASASASPSPTVSPTAAPPTAAPPTGAPRFPIRLDRARAGVAPGASIAIEVAGGSGALATHTSAPILDARYDAATHRLTLVGRTPGTATVTVADSFGDGASIDVLVAPPAGVVPADVTVDLGGNVSTAFALAHADDAIARSAQLQPQATIDVHGISLPATIHPGDRIDAPARVRIAGTSSFVEALGTTTVHVRDDAFPKLDPQVLFYSDDPERLDARADGVLFRATLDPARPARAYVYHVSDTPDRRLYLAFQNAATGSARVQLVGYTAGPENAFGYVGHRSTLQYLLERGAQESAIVDVPEGTPTLVSLGGRALRAGDLVASIDDLRVLSGGALTVSVVAVSGDRDPVEVLGDTEVAGDGHGRRGEFSLVGVPPLASTYAIGGADPPPFAIGMPTIANLRPGGRALGGDYGVLREIDLQLNNPTSAPATAYFYEQPVGGNASTSLWFTGDPAPTEIPCVRVPTNRYAVKVFQLAPGESRTVTGEYMTDGASFFPLLFGLTATPPSPPPGPYDPDACTPKSPPPGASPAPNASPSPVASTFPTSAPAGNGEGR